MWEVPVLLWRICCHVWSCSLFSHSSLGLVSGSSCLWPQASDRNILINLYIFIRRKLAAIQPIGNRICWRGTTVLLFHHRWRGSSAAPVLAPSPTLYIKNCIWGKEQLLQYEVWLQFSEKKIFRGTRNRQKFWFILWNSLCFAKGKTLGIPF